MTAGRASTVERGATSPMLSRTGRILLAPDGLRCEGVPSLDEFERIGEQLQSAHRMLAWWIGDWYNAGEEYHGEVFAQVLDATSLDPDTVLQYARVCRQVVHDRRRMTLSFSHHREVSDLKPVEQTRWLDKAETETWSCHRLRRELARHTRAESRLWVLVEAKNPSDADALCERLRGEGRSAKVIER